MSSTEQSRRDVFRTIAQLQYVEWPAYGSTPLYDRSSVFAFQSDIRTVARVWFDHYAHELIAEFVSQYPLEYVDFGPHDEYSGSTWYQIPQLLRLFLLKEIHGWDHETALLTFLQQQPVLRRDLGFERMPNQSTVWRSWHERFTADLREAVKTAARTILIKAQNVGITVPRKPERKLSYRNDDEDDSVPDDQTVLKQARKITDHVSRIVFPAFSLDRGEGCEIHENAYWGLQTYLGLRENLAANEGARSFMTEEFFRAGIVAIDITEADLFTGNRTGHEDEIIGTKEDTDEYAYQWATVQLVGNAVPIVLDARPVRKGETRLEIVEDLLDSAESLVHVDNVLMDREFDSEHVLEMISQRGLSYVVPKRMQTSEKAQAKRLLRRDQDRYETDRKLHLGKNEWHETTLIYRRKENAEHDNHRQYSVFMTDRGSGHLTEYGYRWEIESGYRSIKRFMAATTSKDFGLRFFYFAFACLLYSIWRAVDLLVQVKLTGEYKHAPVVTADNTLTLLKKGTGIG